MPRKPCVSLRHRLQPGQCFQVELFQKPGKPAVSVKGMKKRLDRQQIDEVCFVVDRFIQALERPGEISHPGCGKGLCQGSDVLPPCELMKSLDTFASSRQTAFLGMGCGKDPDI